MSHSRKLMRSLLADQTRRSKPENRPVKKGTPHKHVRQLTHEDWRLDHTLHVTKGYRTVRTTSL